MKDFRLFDISDFVMDEDFIRWVYEKNKADNDFWKKWLEQNPGKYMAVAEARRILESIHIDQKVITDTEKQYEIDKLMQTISASSHDSATRVISISRKWWYAAAVLLIAAAST